MKIKLITFLIVVSFLLCGCGDNLKDGSELLKKGKYSEAETVFREEIEETSQLLEKTGEDSKKENAKIRASEAHRGLGIAFYEQQKYEEASAELKQALELGGEETPQIYNLLGVCAMNQKDYSSAAEAFIAGTSLTESYNDETQKIVQEMKFNLVICYEKNRDWANAGAAAENYLQDYPEDAKMQKELEFLKTR